MTGKTATRPLYALLVGRADAAVRLLAELVEELKSSPNELNHSKRSELVDEVLRRCWPAEHAQLEFRGVVVCAAAEQDNLAFRVQYSVRGHLEEFGLASAEFPDEVRFDPTYSELSVAFTTQRGESSQFRQNMEKAEGAANSVCSTLNHLISNSREEARTQMLRRLDLVVEGLKVARRALGNDATVTIEFSKSKRPERE